MPDRSTPESILQRGLDIEGPEERAAYLDKVCADDPGLCDEIESLMAAHFAAGAFMDLLAEPVSAGSLSVSRRTKNFVWRNRRGLLSAALLAGLAVAAVIWLGFPACFGATRGRQTGGDFRVTQPWETG